MSGDLGVLFVIILSCDEHTHPVVWTSRAMMIASAASSTAQ